MPSCFWNLCDCPDADPDCCSEHNGTGCSQIAGKAIGKEADVDDPLTRFVESAIAKLEHDVARAKEIHKALADRKAQLEKEKADLERQARAAKTRADRQALIDEERAIAKRHEHIETEIRDLVTELNALGASYNAAAARISPALIIPFYDAAGYCECYDAKLASLSRLDTLIKIETRTLAAAVTALAAAKAGALTKLAITFAIGLVVFLVLILFVFTGGLEALVISAFLAEIGVAIGVIATAIDLYLCKRAVLQSQIALLKLSLSYYRIQQIPTCVECDDDDCDDDGGDDGEEGGEDGEE